MSQRILQVTTKLLLQYHYTSHDVGRVVEHPDFYLSVLDALELNQTQLPPANFRRMLIRIVKKGKALPDELVAAVSNKIKGYGRRRWGFQVVLASLESPKLATTRQVTQSFDCEDTEFFNKGFKFLQYVGHMNAKADIRLQETSPRQMAIEMCDRVHAALPHIRPISFLCNASDFFFKREPAIYCNEACKLMGGDHEKDFLFAPATHSGSEFFANASCARVGQVVPLGVLPCVPLCSEDPYFYLMCFGFPFKGLVFLWGYASLSPNMQDTSPVIDVLARDFATCASR